MNSSHTTTAALLLTVSGLFAPALAQESPRERVDYVSIIQLIASPEKYQGKLVSVRGFVRLEFEGNAIYLHREDYEQRITSNGLWINAQECTRPDGKTFDTGFALVVGRFTGQSHGHGGLWSGSIDEVRECVSYPGI